MGLIDVFQAFQTQEQAVEYLEWARWRGEPTCPYCAGLSVGPHASGDRANSRWQCHTCGRAFAVTVGTLFHGTHVPLRDWFLVLALTLNAEKPASAYRIARDIGRRRATVWSMMNRIRTAMSAEPDQALLLRRIVKDERSSATGTGPANSLIEPHKLN
jgi:transposase-like protein